MILWHVMLDQDGCCPEMQLVSGKVLRDLSERWSHSCTVQGCGARKRWHLRCKAAMWIAPSSVLMPHFGETAWEKNHFSGEGGAGERQSKKWEKPNFFHTLCWHPCICPALFQHWLHWFQWKYDLLQCSSSSSSSFLDAQWICNHVFTLYILQLPWRWLWWLRALFDLAGISHEQHTVCVRPALVQTPSPGHSASALRGISCKQLLAKISPFTSSSEHLSFVPVTQGALHIPGSTAAPQGQLRWSKEGLIHSGASLPPLNLLFIPSALEGSSLVLAPSPQNFIWSAGDFRWSPSVAGLKGVTVILLKLK